MAEKLPEDLGYFTGSGRLTRTNPFVRSFLATEGMIYLAEQCEAFWFLDLIASYQLEAKVRRQPFQIWSIELDGKGGCYCRMKPDSDKKPIVEQHLEYTTFPENFECWAEGPNQEGGVTVMLKSER